MSAQIAQEKIDAAEDQASIQIIQVGSQADLAVKHSIRQFGLFWNLRRIKRK